MTEELIYVGIDVAKDRVDVATRPADQHWSVSYDAAGVEALVAKLQVLEPAAVILEATGGLELPLVAAVAAAALPVAVVNPRQVRDFARSTGQLAKNDQLDARILAHFGEAVRPPIRPLRDADTQVFGAMLVSLFRIYRPVNWEFFRIYPPDFQGHQATLGATSAIIAALWN